MEFTVKTDLNQLPKTIDFNFEEMKSGLSEKLTYYNNLVVTEDSIKDAKDDKAKLNKLHKFIEAKRMDVKKACLAPYEAFEKQCKEITSMIQQPILAIEKQIKVFEDIEQQQKWEQIEAYYKAEVKELKELVPLDKIVSSKWKNKTEPIENICNGIGDTLDKIRTDLETIENLHSEFEHQIVDAYLNDYNLSRALQEQKRLEEQKKQIEAKKAAQQAIVKSNPQPTTPQVVEPLKPTESPVQTTQNTQTTQAKEPIYSASFKVTGTRTQLQGLAAFMKKYNINYEVIK